MVLKIGAGQWGSLQNRQLLEGHTVFVGPSVEVCSVAGLCEVSTARLLTGSCYSGRPRVRLHTVRSKEQGARLVYGLLKVHLYVLYVSEMAAEMISGQPSPE